MPRSPGGVADFVESVTLWLVLAAASLGLALSAPGRAASEGPAVPLALAVLVFTTGLTIGSGELRLGGVTARRALLAALVAAAALPLLAWLAARVVADPDLQHGVLAAGVDPTEVAAVGLTAIAGGRVAVATLLLLASTALSVVLAGPVLTALGAPPAGAGGGTAGLLATLILVVVVPLTAGVGVRALVHRPWILDGARLTAVVALAALIWLVASQVDLRVAYLQVAGAFLLFVGAAAALGGTLGSGRPRDEHTAVLLSTGMRDFAVAAGIATAAYGARTAAPLAVYGVLVIVGGAAFSARQRPTRPPAEA